MLRVCSEDCRLKRSFGVSQNSGFQSAHFALENAGPEKSLAVFGFEATLPTPATLLRAGLRGEGVVLCRYLLPGTRGNKGTGEGGKVALEESRTKGGVGHVKETGWSSEDALLRVVGAVAVLVGGGLLAGWAAQAVQGGGMSRTGSAAGALTALGFLFNGAAILFQTARGLTAEAVFKRSAQVALAGAAAVGLLALAELFRQPDALSERLFTNGDAASPQAGPQGVGFNGAACLLLLPACVWTLGRGPRAHPAALAWGGALLVAAAAAGFAARLEAVEGEHPWLSRIRIELPAAVLFMVQGGSFVWVAAKRSLFRWALGRALTLEFLGGLVLLVWMALLAHASAASFGHAILTSGRSREVLDHIHASRLAVAELESLARDALWSGDAETARRFAGGDVPGPNGFGASHRKLGALTAADPFQSRRLGQLQDALIRWMEYDRETVALRQLQGFEAAQRRLGSPEARERKARVLALLSEMEAAERQRLAVGENRLHAALERTVALLPSGALVGILVLSYGMVRLSVEMNFRERLSKALKLTEERQRLTVEAAGIGDWEMNPATQVTAHSLLHDRIFGYADPVPEWSHDHFLAHVHPEDRDRVDALFKEGLQSGGEWAAECRILRRDGTPGWIWLRAKCFKNEAGRVEAVRGVLGDITERHAAEDQIRSLNATLEQRVRERTEKLEFAVKELDAFTYSVSHDLRAPLRAIDGFSRMVIEDYASLLPAEADRKLGVIRSEARRMSRLIDDLLTFSRMGRAPSHAERIDMQALAQETYQELLETAAETRQIRFKVHPLPAATGTQTMIKQLWINLISNALKFTRGREVASIEVGSRRDPGGNTVYYIKDNGVGFDMRHAGKLFGVFQRLHTENEFEGTGAGLALVQRIVSRHGGTVWAEAQKDKGATFFFTLPPQTV